MTEIFDPATATWSTTRDILFARYKHTAELLPDGRVMIAGGIEGDDDGAYSDSVEVYDPATGTWTAVEPTLDVTATGP